MPHYAILYQIGKAEYANNFIVILLDVPTSMSNLLTFPMSQDYNSLDSIPCTAEEYEVIYVIAMYKLIKIYVSDIIFLPSLYHEQRLTDT